MRAEELRLGNWLFVPEIGDTYTDRTPYVEEFCFQVSQINIWGVRLDIGHGAVQKCNFDETIEPIPLTEEWLVKFGFYITNLTNCYFKYWGTNGIEIILIDYHYKGGFEYELGKGKYKKIEYVHQLQNIYFALTGQELTINEK